MKLLLDTHVFIWWDSDPAQLSTAALAALTDPGNEILLSAVSAWEIVIKSQLGKLNLRLPVDQIIRQQQANGLLGLSISVEHTLAVAALPAIHKDPFDRLLVAQSKVENATLVSADHLLGGYGIPLLW